MVIDHMIDLFNIPRNFFEAIVVAITMFCTDFFEIFDEFRNVHLISPNFGGKHNCFRYVDIIRDFLKKSMTNSCHAINYLRPVCLLSVDDVDFVVGVIEMVIFVRLSWTARYNTKKIEDINYDDELLVWDFDNGCFATAKPSWISKPQLYPYYYKITLEDGTQLDLIGSDGDCH